MAFSAPPPRVMARARLRALIASMLVAAFFSACSEEGVKETPPQGNLCDSDADCSELTPRCIGLDLSASGKIAKTCVMPCDLAEGLDASQCPRFRHPLIDYRVYACVGINAEGHLDPTSSDGICAQLCDEPGLGRDDQLARCPPLAGPDWTRDESMICARLEYNELSGALLFCLEPDTPTPPAIVPRYRNCDSSAECSPITPECRHSQYTENYRSLGFCTLSCERDEDCPIDVHTSEGPTPGRCLGIGADGLVDLDSNDKVCFPGCGGDACIRGAGTPEQTFGICVLADPERSEEYGWFCI